MQRHGLCQRLLSLVLILSLLVSGATLPADAHNVASGGQALAPSDPPEKEQGTPAPSPPPAGGTAASGGTAPAGAGKKNVSADPPAAPATPAPTTPPAPTPAPAPAAPAATTTAYTVNNLNQYTRVGTATYAYDKNGNLTSDGTHTYGWDAENRLTTATIPGAAGAAATTASYSYDEYHRRVKKTVGTTTTYFLWSGDTLLAEYSGTGTLQRRYLYAGDFAPAQVHDIAGTTTAVYDVHTDHLDTPRLLTDSTGATVWTSHHEPFGKAHIASDPDGDGTHLAFPFRFPGQYEDDETGLHYNRYRYYDPHIGRYLSPDPLGQRGGIHTYQYALNDPVHITDSRGLAIDTVIDVISAGYSLYKLLTSKCDAEFNTNLLALGADLLAIVIPGVTGAGTAVRAARAADNAIDVAKASNKADNAADVARSADNAADAAKGADNAADAARPGGGGGGGRNRNHLRPDPRAGDAPHTVFRTNPETGRIENYQTFDPHGQVGGNKRFRGTGKTHSGVEPPLVLEPPRGHPRGNPTRSRPARPDELPRGF